MLFFATLPIIAIKLPTFITKLIFITTKTTSTFTTITISLPTLLSEPIQFHYQHLVLCFPPVASSSFLLLSFLLFSFPGRHPI